MARLIYTGNVSLDGYTEDPDGKLDFSAPDVDVHAFINDLERPVATYLYGRRLYETMECWETDPTLATQSPTMRDYAELWQAAEKIVYSTTLQQPVTARTRIERVFDPGAVQRLKDESDRDLSVGGAELAAHAIRAGLVDEYRLFVHPIVVGGGKPYLPADVRIKLALVDEHRFPGGVVHLRYRAQS
ncbi:MAG TPA: dihydrofolate reductase family protein [Amycolatopsis sp.]|nr:dihydrofolate reductase family protein [Amycolatopsis sp.]